MNRFIDLFGKFWKYLLALAETPSEIPFILYHVVSKRAHLGEMLIVSKYKKWLQSHNIRTIIDAGANTGQYASAILSIFPEATLHSFEPIPEVYGQLEDRFSRYYPTATSHLMAVGDAPGKLSFHANQFNKASSLLPMTERNREEFPWADTSTTIEVEVQTIDNALSALDITGPVLFKLDVQGFELNALRGAEHTLSICDLVWVETSFAEFYENQSMFDDVYQFLTERGFIFFGNLDQTISQKDGGIIQSDSLFVREK